MSLGLLSADVASIFLRHEDEIIMQLKLEQFGGLVGPAWMDKKRTCNRKELVAKYGILIWPFGMISFK